MELGCLHLSLLIGLLVSPRTRGHFLGSAGLAPGVPPPQVMQLLFAYFLSPTPLPKQTHFPFRTDSDLPSCPGAQPEGRPWMGRQWRGGGGEALGQLGVLPRGTRAWGSGQVHPTAVLRLWVGGGHLSHLEAREDRLSRVVGAEGSPAGWQERSQEDRCTQPNGEAGSSPMAPTQKQTDAGALEEGGRAAQKEKGFLELGVRKAPPELELARAAFSASTLSMLGAVLCSVGGSAVSPGLYPLYTSSTSPRPIIITKNVPRVARCLGGGGERHSCPHLRTTERGRLRGEACLGRGTWLGRGLEGVWGQWERSGGVGVTSHQVLWVSGSTWGLCSE